MGLLQNGLFSEIAMVPNDSDAPFLARRGGAERHEDSENGADGAFCKKAIMVMLELLPRSNPYAIRPL